MQTKDCSWKEKMSCEFGLLTVSRRRVLGVLKSYIYIYVWKKPAEKNVFPVIGRCFTGTEANYSLSWQQNGENKFEKITRSNKK